MVFELAAAGAEAVLYDFCQQNKRADDANPSRALIMGSAGNRYGTTNHGRALFAFPAEWLRCLCRPRHAATQSRG